MEDSLQNIGPILEGKAGVNQRGVKLFQQGPIQPFGGTIRFVLLRGGNFEVNTFPGAPVAELSQPGFSTIVKANAMAALLRALVVIEKLFDFPEELIFGGNGHRFRIFSKIVEEGDPVLRGVVTCATEWAPDVRVNEVQKMLTRGKGLFVRAFVHSPLQAMFTHDPSGNRSQPCGH